MTLDVLPRNGSIVIVDDQVEEARPLIELLSSVGCASTYYTGDDVGLPQKPIQKVRLAFFDIQFAGAVDANTYAANILRLIERIIPIDNGPYVLILWSMTQDNVFEEVEMQVLAPVHKRKPIKVIRLSKKDYFESKDDEALQGFRDLVLDELAGRFDQNDENAIRTAISETQGGLSKDVLKDGSLDKISKNLMKGLEVDLAPFLFFIAWEKLITESAAGTTALLSNVFPSDENWSKNTMKLIYRLGHAQYEQQAKSVSPLALAHGALATIHATFSDIVESEIAVSPNFDKFVSKKDMMKIGATRSGGGHDMEVELNYLSGLYSFKIDGVQSGDPQGDKKLKNLKVPGATDAQISIFKEILDEFDRVAVEINTRLLIEKNIAKTVQPGNLYLANKPTGLRRRKFLETYFGPETRHKFTKGPNKGKHSWSISELNKINFVELEVSPACDYAQNKWEKNRLLPGVLVPIELVSKLKMYGLPAFYDECPILKDVDGNDKKLVLNYRLLKSISVGALKPEEPILRLRKELLSDITSHMAHHVSRLGITHL